MHFFSCILIYLFVLSVINPATQRPSESSLTCLTPPASLGIATQQFTQWEQEVTSLIPRGPAM